MSDESLDFSALKQAAKEKRLHNKTNSIALLDSHKISYRILNGSNCHLLVEGSIDYWPTTGVWMIRKTNIRGRGIFSLIEKLK